MRLQIADITGPINTPKWAIEGVPAANVMAPWRRCWELLEPAARRYQGQNKWTSESLLYEVATGNCQLWIAWSWPRRRVEGAVITRLMKGLPIAPAEQVCECVLVGGEGLPDWGPGMMGLLRAWALDQGCTWIGGTGRKGWLRAFGMTEVGKDEYGAPVMALPLRGVRSSVA